MLPGALLSESERSKARCYSDIYVLSSSDHQSVECRAICSAVHVEQLSSLDNIALTSSPKYVLLTLAVSWWILLRADIAEERLVLVLFHSRDARMKETRCDTLSTHRSLSISYARTVC